MQNKIYFSWLLHYVSSLAVVYILIGNKSLDYQRIWKTTFCQKNVVRISPVLLFSKINMIASVCYKSINFNFRKCAKPKAFAEDGDEKENNIFNDSHCPIRLGMELH